MRRFYPHLQAREGMSGGCHHEDDAINKKKGRSVAWMACSAPGLPPQIRNLPGSGHNQLMAGAPFASISDFHRVPLPTKVSDKNNVEPRNRKWQPTHVEEGYILAASVVYHPTKSLCASNSGSSKNIRSKYPLFREVKKQFRVFHIIVSGRIDCRPNLEVVTTLIYF